MERVANLTLAPSGAERLALSTGLKLLLSTDTPEQVINLHQVASAWSKPALNVVDAFPLTDDVKGIPVPGRPMAVAVHPVQPLALALSQPRDVRDKGEVLFLDLREKTPGRLLRSQLVGYRPAHIAITPDGRWAIVANKAEGYRRTTGSIGILDLRNLAGLETDRIQEVPYHEIPGVAEKVGVTERRLEPGFVAIDQKSQFAAVVFHRNDAIAWIDLRSGEPVFAGVMNLPAGSKPTEISLLDEKDGSILAALTETGFQQVSFYRIMLSNDKPTVQRLSGVDVRQLIDSNYALKRRDPSSVLLRRVGDHPAALVASSRSNRTLLFDLADPTHPHFVARVASAAPAMDLMPIEEGNDLFVLTGNGDGTATVLRIHETP